MRKPGRSRLGNLTILASLFLVVNVPILAQSIPSGEEDPVGARAFRVHFRPLADAFELVSSVLSEDGQITLQPRLRTLLIQDRISVLDRIGPLLESFDLPPRNVDITLSLFLGTDPREAEAGKHVPARELAQEIRGVAETLSNFTKWTAYESLGSRALAGNEGSTLTADLSDNYRVVLEVGSVQDKVVNFRSVTLLRAVLGADGDARFQEVYKARVAVRPGQTQLVGAAKKPTSKRALFLTLVVNPR